MLIKFEFPRNRVKSIVNFVTTLLDGWKAYWHCQYWQDCLLQRAQLEKFEVHTPMLAD